mgnify:CR=1 FL=1
MPRQKKPINYEEEISKIDMQIVKWKNTIKELEAKKNQLQQEQREQDINNLYNIIKSSGKSVTEILGLIQAS